MCQIIIKPEGLLTNIPNLDRAKDKNKDGFGVMWYDTQESRMRVFKTLDYEAFKNVIETYVKECSAVIHLRFASKGEVSLENVHPFKTSKGGLLCHNGTLQSWGNATTSDTKEFADTFNELDIDWEVPATDTLVGHTIGTAYNKIVVMLPNGHIKVFNKNLFIEEEGILYSNTGHHEPVKYVPYVYNKPQNTEPYNYWDDVYEQPAVPFYKEKFKIFVYGTLKKGKSNSNLLQTATFLYKAQTVKKFAMVGKDKPFPYILGESELGEHIIGEVYEVDEDVKEILDILEGVPHHYMEQEILVNILYFNSGRGIQEIPVSVYTKTETTKRPSLIKGYDSTKFIKEW